MAECSLVVATVHALLDLIPPRLCVSGDAGERSLPQREAVDGQPRGGGAQRDGAARGSVRTARPSLDDIEQGLDRVELTVEIEPSLGWAFTAAEPVEDERRDALLGGTFCGLGGPRVDGPERSGAGDKDERRTGPAAVIGDPVAGGRGGELGHYRLLQL